MARSLVISHVADDEEFAEWLAVQLRLQRYDVHIISTTQAPPLATDRIKSAAAVLLILSPVSAASDVIMQHAALAKQYARNLIPVLVQNTYPLPWYLDGLTIEDFTTELDQSFAQLLRRLPEPEAQADRTLGSAREVYLNRATLKSQHTIDSYRRAIDLFLDFLHDRTAARKLPIGQTSYVLPGEIPLEALSDTDAPIFLHFAEWLLSSGSGKRGDKRPYKASSVELRLAGVMNWFQFMDDHGWLPAQFQLARAKRIVRDELRSRPQRSGPPQPPEHLEEVIYYYDTLQKPRHLLKPNVDAERVRRWELTRLRNRALLHSLAETGGRISEVLSLNLADFPARYLMKNEVLRVEVLGKGGHHYYLRFFDALSAIRAYVEARGANLRASLQGDIPLFVSHDKRYDGNRMSRVVAWRVVNRAARALGLKSITPHDFRHWRATQLINAGHSLDVVQDYLGHRSVETTRAYYAHTDPLRVDDAAKNTGLPDPDSLEN